MQTIDPLAAILTEHTGRPFSKHPKYAVEKPHSHMDGDWTTWEGLAEENSF